MEERKAFNFLRSYYDVFMALTDDKDKLQFIEAIIIKQFEGKEPKDLTPMAKVCYVGQKHALDASLNGYLTKVKGIKDRKNNTPCQAPKQDPKQYPIEAPCQQEKEEVKEEEKEEEEDKSNKQISFEIFWSKYPKKIAKKNCIKKFNKLKQEDINIILSSIDDFIKYKPFDNYNHPNPYTYLNQERWKDQIFNKKSETKTLRGNLPF